MSNSHHEYEEVHLNDEEDIELVGGGSNDRRRQRRPPPPSAGGGTTSSSTKWIVILFLIALVGVYKLGMEEGKAEVQHEGLLEDGDGGTANSKYSEVVTKTHENNNDEKDPAAVAKDEPINSVETTTTTSTTTSPPKPPMKFTMDQLNNMRSKCNDLINELDNYYFGKETAIAMLMNSYIEPWDFNEVDDVVIDQFVESTDPSIVSAAPPRKLRAMKLVNTMLRALVSDSQRAFLMGGIGSSVMAGHDNW